MMTDIDELKLAYAEENPDAPSDARTLAFRSTLQASKPSEPPAIRPKSDGKGMPGLRLTTSLSHGVPTPAMAAGLLWLTALVLAVAVAATESVTLLPPLAAAVASALGAGVRPVYRFALGDVERRFGLTVVDTWSKPGERGLHVRFLDVDGGMHEGRLVLAGRHATVFDEDDRIMAV